MQEYGYESFGFGFPIVVFSPQEAPDKVIRAPLFIWRLSVQKDFAKSNSWTISRSLDQEIQYNDLLRSYLSELCDLTIQGFEDNELDDNVLSFDEIIQNTAQFIQKFSSSSSGNELANHLKEQFKKGLQAIPDRNFLDEAATSIPSVYWSGVFGRFHQRNETIRKEMREDLPELLEQYPDEDEETLTIAPYLHSESSVPTDPSQLGILNYLKENKHVVIQGPPGTGKSQTITAILLNALEQGKRTLVVCEKKTAMQVLKENLKEVHPKISELVAVIDDVSRDRKEVVNSVRDRHTSSGYERVNVPSEKSIASKLSIIEDKINEIHRKKKFLYTEPIIDSDKEPGWHDGVGYFLKAKFKNGRDSLRKELEKQKIQLNSVDFNDLRDTINKLELLSKKVDHNNNLHFISDEHFRSRSPIELREDLENLLEKNLDELETFVINYSRHLQDVKNKLYTRIDELLNIIIETHAKLGLVSTQLTSQRLVRKRNWWYTLVRVLGKVSSNIRSHIDAFEEAPDLLKSIQKDLAKIRVDIAISPDVSVSDISAYYLEIGQKIKTLQSQLTTVKQRLLNKLFNTSILDISLDETIIRELNRRIEQLHQLKVSPVFKEGVQNISVSDLNRLLQGLQLLLDYSVKFNEADEQGFFDHYDWQSEYRMQSEELKKILSVFQENKIDNWENQFAEFFLNNQLSQKFDHKKTGGFEAELQALERTKQELQKEIANRIPKIWRAKQAEVNQKINIPKLYNKRGSRGKRRNSLRKIVRGSDRAFDAFTAYFPVVMVNPAVCASIIPLEPELFDIVIFDEASQLKIEESLSTLIRGERKVVSGDKHQMPPSYWFTSIGADELEIDEDGEVEEFESKQEELQSREGALTLADSESLLEFAELCDFESWYLDFHYRSHHPLLIEFSNAAFYKSRLYPLPERISQPPIQFFQINGLYDRQQNKDEAEAVVQILKQLKRERSGELPSVGVATFNLQQRNLIWDLIKREIQIDEAFRTKYEELEKNGFFIKNLENIQGDERDVVILSTTFGVRKDDRFIAHYGPLNLQEHGRRLLNVIVTRARKKVFVLTSIPEERFNNYRQELGSGTVLERGYLHAYLAYAKAVSEGNREIIESIRDFFRTSAGVLQKDVQLAESPFEEAVYEALCSELDPDRIELQHHAGGFRIDLVVKSKKTGRPFIAVECDGATYHGKLEDYSWDNYRQKLLEQHGFVFHRIWSRDWWENSERELNKLVQFIHEQDSKDPGAKPFDSPPAEHIELGEEYIYPKRLVRRPTPERQQGRPAHKTVQTEIEEFRKDDQATLFEPEPREQEPKVGIGSEVKVRFLKDNKDVTIKLVRGQAKGEERDGIAIIHEKSPMGVAVIGKRVGETFEIGNLEKYCRVVEIR